MKDNCLFCKIVGKKVPADILYEDEDVIVMMDAYPNVDGHVLVIPKKHYTDIFEIPADVLTKVIDIGKKETLRIMNKLNKKSLTFLINYGEQQAIKHFHLHLLPNFGKEEPNMDKKQVYEILSSGD